MIDLETGAFLLGCIMGQFFGFIIFVVIAILIFKKLEKYV